MDYVHVYIIVSLSLSPAQRADDDGSGGAGGGGGVCGVVRDLRASHDAQHIYARLLTGRTHTRTLFGGT